MGWLRDRRVNRKAAIVAATVRMGEASVWEISVEAGLRVAVTARVVNELADRGVLVARVVWPPSPGYAPLHVYRTAPPARTGES